MRVPDWRGVCSGIRAMEEMLALLERCIALERGAAAIYDALADRFAADAELRALWHWMAADERAHARKLATWRALVEAEPAEHAPRASGFDAAVARVEALMAESCTAAASVEEEDAFDLALTLELSELDAIYTALLQASPIARHPDLADTVRVETAAHHETLLAIVRRRARSEKTLLRAALLAGRHT